jgi:hypothetical protein
MLAVPNTAAIQAMDSKDCAKKGLELNFMKDFLGRKNSENKTVGHVQAVIPAKSGT